MLITDNVKVFETQYDDDCTDTTCRLEIELDQKLVAPVYLYLEMRNFYQNYWNIVRSVSYLQLQGRDLAESELAVCSPVITYDDAELADVNITAPTAHKDDPDFPCGLLPRSFGYAQDTFKIYKGALEIEIDQEDIAWEGDTRHRFTNLDDWRDKQWTDVEQEHFIVWMRTSNLPWFIKLWGSIDETLEAGKYTVVVTNGEA
jgi:hypothetical protein